MPVVRRCGAWAARIAGLTIVVSPSVTTPLVLDSQQLGGMADEQASALSDLDMQVKWRR
ncbi:hypothetical protein [Actinomadura sp. 6N118]|uniref:hypothetical protein n=1 Tax=Actinomadura sp. 6N118 TaxID=3375151 RepID=UPI0037B3D2C7